MVEPNQVCPVCRDQRPEVHLAGSAHSFSSDAFGSSRTDLSYGRILRCRRCRLAYSEARPTDEELARLYRDMDTAVYESETEARSRTAARHLKIVSRFVSRGAMLDVGCASGMFLEQAASVGWSGAGVEPSGTLYREAKQRLAGRGEVLATTLEEANLPAASFDAVTLWDVLEHVREPVEFLQRCRILLKPQCFVFVNVPDCESLPARLLGRRWPLLLPEHLNYFNRRSLSACGERGGLSPVAWGRRPVSFSVSYILYRLAQHRLPGVDRLRRVASFTPGFPFWPSWSVYDSRLPAAMQRFSHCCQVRYSFRCRSGLRMLADHGVPAKPEGPLATPLPRRPSVTRVRWLFRAVDVTLRAQVAPKFAAACRRTTSGSDAPPQAATNNIARASRAVRPSSSADAASSSATSF